MDALDNLKSVLCDPSGKCCIKGSQADRDIVDRALAAIAKAEAERVKPDNDKVICPECTNQFRAIPQNVQTLMLAAGFEPPFTTPPAAAVSVALKKYFCYCNKEVSLQMVSGGAAPEGYLGKVTLRVGDQYRDYFAQPDREALTKDDVRAAGGIVHSDGNIFFTNIEQLNAAIRSK